MHETHEVPTASDISAVITEAAYGNTAADTTLAMRETLVLLGFSADEMGAEIDGRTLSVREFTECVAISYISQEAKVAILSDVATMYNNDPSCPRQGRSMVLTWLRHLETYLSKRATYEAGSFELCGDVSDLYMSCKREILPLSASQRANKLLATLDLIGIFNEDAGIYLALLESSQT